MAINTTTTRSVTEVRIPANTMNDGSWQFLVDGITQDIAPIVIAPSQIDVSYTGTSSPAPNNAVLRRAAIATEVGVRTPSLKTTLLPPYLHPTRKIA
ncbi:MAG: hypothetical protein ACFB0B_11870 [Thermonemataceae bacterium]